MQHNPFACHTASEPESQKLLSAASEADLHIRLAQLETQVATLQTQLTDLAFQLLREREQRLHVLEAQLSSIRSEAVVPFAGPAPGVSESQEMPPFACHPTEQRTPLIPLIEYGARGRYVLISPEGSELPITPDSPEWFASLSSFRFLGQSGRFSARRGYNRGPNRCWYAQRGIHQKNYSRIHWRQ